VFLVVHWAKAGQFIVARKREAAIRFELVSAAPFPSTLKSQPSRGEPRVDEAELKQPAIAPLGATASISKQVFRVAHQVATLLLIQFGDPNCLRANPTSSRLIHLPRCPIAAPEARASWLNRLALGCQVEIRVARRFAFVFAFVFVPAIMCLKSGRVGWRELSTRDTRAEGKRSDIGRLRGG